MNLIKNVLDGIKNENYPVGNPINYGPSIKLLNTLKRQGYNNYQAICDILDNSIDAFNENDNDKFIKININFNRESKKTKYLNDDSYIMIADNGSGFNSKEILNEALRLGTELEKGNNLDKYLGCYGVGLKLSAISIGNLFTIITKNKHGEYLTGIFDTDKAFKSKSWDFHYVRKSKKEEIKLLKEHIGKNTGTIVIINKIDSNELSTIDGLQFKSSLIKTVGEIFRYFISENDNDNKINFFINNKKINKIDPMCRDLEGTEILNSDDFEKDYTYKYEYIDKNKKPQNIKIKLKYYFIDPNASIDDNRKPSSRNQGIYILRNNRQIVRATLFGLTVKHMSYNFFRGELFYDGKYDNVFKTDSKKTNIILPDAVLTKINEDFDRFRNETKRKYRKLKNNDDIKNDESDNKYLIDTNKLPLPNVEKNSKGDEIEKPSLTIESKGGKNGKKYSKRTDKKIDITKVALSERDVFFYPRPTGKKKWDLEFNVNHPFYERFKRLNYESQYLIYDLLYGVALASYQELYGSVDVNQQQKDELIERFFESWSDQIKRIIKAKEAKQ